MKSNECAIYVVPEQPGTAFEIDSQQQSSNVRKLRTSVRRKVNIRALAKWQSTFVPIEVRNISQGGAGLRIRASIAAGAHLLVAMPDGRQISGRVRWSRLGFCGIEFEQPLAGDDELFGELKPREPLGADLAAASIVAFPARNPSGGDAARSRSEPVRDRGPFQSALEGLQKLCKAGGNRQRDKLVERACRKQGFSWLADSVPTITNPWYV